MLRRSRRGRGAADESGVDRLSIKLWHADVSRIKVWDRYEVDYSKIVVGVDRETGVKKYLVIDPEVDSSIRRKVERVLYKIVFHEKETWTADELIKYIAEKERIRDEVVQYIIKRNVLGFGPIDPLVRDPYLEDIECLGANQPLTVVHNVYGRLETNLTFTKDELDKLVIRLVHMTGKALSIDRPRVDNASVRDPYNPNRVIGRLAATKGGEITVDSTFTLRKFPEKPWTVTRLMKVGTITPEIAAWLWLLVENQRPVLVAGGVGAGKTSFANAIIGLAPPDRKICVIEDVSEFNIPHPYVIRHFTRESYTSEGRGEISMEELVRHALRIRPDYIVINEIRGAEAKVWFQAISVGHGGVTSIHAEDAKALFSRLKYLGISPSDLSSLSSIVFILRTVIGDRMVRRITGIYDVVDPERQEFNLLFKYDITSDRYEIPKHEELLRTRSAKLIMSIHGWPDSKLIEEYSKRVDFMRWLLEYSRQDPSIDDVKNIVKLFIQYYRDPDFYKKMKIRPRGVEEERTGKRTIAEMERKMDVRKEVEIDGVRCEIAYSKASVRPGSVLDLMVKFVVTGKKDAKKSRRACIAFLIDVSKSMEEFNKLSEAKKVITELINTLPPDDIVMVAAFSSKVKIIAKPTVMDDDGKKQVISKVSKLGIGTHTALYDAVRTTLRTFSEGIKTLLGFKTYKFDQECIKRIILLTDGEPDVGPKDVNDYARLGKIAKSLNIPIICVGIGPDYDERILYALASESGGRWYHASKVDEIRSIIRTEVSMRDVRPSPVIKLRLAKGVEIVESYKIGNTVSRVDPNIEDDMYVFSLDELKADGEQIFVTKLKVTKSEPGSANLGHMVVQIGDKTYEHDIMVDIGEDSVVNREPEMISSVAKGVQLLVERKDVKEVKEVIERISRNCLS